MVHARYGSKDAVLDAIFMREYVAQLSPDLDPEANGCSTHSHIWTGSASSPPRTPSFCGRCSSPPSRR